MGAIANLFGYLLNGLYQVFNNYGIAIIIFSVILRVVLLPLTVSQQKTMKKSAKLQTKLQEIQKKYKNNPEKLNQETMDLYKREKMNPLSGCLSSILQLILILSVFWLVSKPLTYMKKVDSNIINTYTQELKDEGNNNNYTEIAIIDKMGGEDPEVYINMDFLGLNLSAVPSQNLNDIKVYIIPILYVITSFISIKLTNVQQYGKKKKDEEEKENSDEKALIKSDDQDDSMESMQQMSKSMTYMMPLMTIFIAFIAPLGLALYWFVSNLLMIVERLIINFIVKKHEEKKEETENV